MEILQLYKILKEYPLFQDLSQDEFSPLVEGHRFKNLRHHDTFVKVGDSAEQFAIVLTGAFKLVRPTPKGDEAIMYFATPGDVIGGLVMLKPEGRYPVSAVAMGPSTLLSMPRSTYQTNWVKNAKVQAKLNSMLYTRMSVLQDEKVISKLTLQQRIAALLVKLMGRSSEARIPIPLTRQEIADSVGATVEAVIRSMSELSQQGIIRTEDKQIEILKPDKIAEILKNI